MQDFLLPVLTCELTLLYGGMVERLASGGPDLAARERSALGWDHAEAAAHVMHKWGFPDELVCGVRLHHGPEAVLADDRLRGTSVAAAALAGLLPDAIPQCPDGAGRLATLCRDAYGLDAVELAARVDERLLAEAPSRDGEPPLATRIERAALVAA